MFLAAAIIVIIGDNQPLIPFTSHKNFQISAITTKCQIIKGNTCAKVNLILAFRIRYRIQAVAKIPDIGIIAPAAVQIIVAFASDEHIIAASAVNSVIAAVTINNIVIISSAYIVTHIALYQRQAAGWQINAGFIGKFQSNVAVFRRIKITADNNTLIPIAVDGNFQIPVIASESQIIKSNTRTKLNNVLTVAVGYRIQTVAEIPDIGVIAPAAVQIIVAFAADERIIAASAVNSVIAAVTVYNIVIISSAFIVTHVALYQRQPAGWQINAAAVSKFQSKVAVFRKIKITADNNTLIPIAVDGNFQIPVIAPKSQIIISYSGAELNAVFAAVVGYRIQAVAEVPDIGIVSGATLQIVVAFAADERIIAASGTDCVIAAVTVNNIVIVCRADVISRIILYQRQTAGWQINAAAVSKFQSKVAIFRKIKITADNDTLTPIAVDGNFQIPVIASESQIIKGNTRAKLNSVLTAVVGYRIPTVTQVPHIGIVAAAALLIVVAFTAD